MKAYELREAIGLDGLTLNPLPAEPEPEPGHGQLVVRMRAAALNYRDQGVVKGVYGYTKFPLALAACNLIRLPRLLAVLP